MATIRPRKKKGDDGRITTVFHVQVRMAGYPARTATFPTERLARRWATTVEAEMIEGRHFKSALSRRRNVGEAIDRYIAEVLPANKDTRNPAIRLAWWKKRIGNLTLADLTSEIVDAQLSHLLREPYTRAKPTAPGSTVGGTPNKFKRSRKTVNRYAAALSRVCTVARRRWKWMAHNPFEGVEREKEGKGRVNILSKDDREKLLAATDADKTPDGMLLDVLVRTALSSTTRAGELIARKWREVEFPALDDVEQIARILLPDTKNETTRIAFVMGDALIRLRALKERAEARGVGGPDDFVFASNRYKGKVFRYTKPLADTCKRAGVPHTVFHILRHMAATDLARAGATEQQLRAIGGWKSNIVRKYVHLAAEDAKEVVQRMNQKSSGEKVP